MKKMLFLVLVGIGTLLSCEKASTVEEEFEIINGEVKEKLISKLEGRDAYGESVNVIFNYDGQNRLSSISDGNETTTFTYNSGGELISAVTRDFPGGEPSLLTFSELYQAPYDVFDNGEVLEHDSNGNPSKILVFEDGYNSATLTGDIFYDSKPNPFFYTIKSSMMLDVLDKTRFNFGYQSPEIIKARALLPNNIIKGMIFKDSEGITISELQFSYSYDDDDYPVQADIFILDEGKTYNYYMYYFYK